MKLAKLLSGIDIKEGCYDPELEITGVSYDSRQTKPGEAFVAIPGFASDGYRFIPKALERGAAVVICEREPEQKTQYVQVASCRRALARLGANWFSHPADKMTMIGVTGTNGKTSITYLLKTVLEQTLGAKVGLIGTIQNSFIRHNGFHKRPFFGFTRNDIHGALRRFCDQFHKISLSFMKNKKTLTQNG